MTSNLTHAKADNCTYCESGQDALVASDVQIIIDDAKPQLESALIICCQRHGCESAALETLRLVLQWRQYFVGAGLASSELVVNMV
jgi:adenosine deaminase